MTAAKGNLNSTMKPLSCSLTHGPSDVRIAATFRPSRTPPVFNAPKPPKSARQARYGAQHHHTASQGGEISKERPQLLQRLAAVACVGGPWHAVLLHCLVNALSGFLISFKRFVRPYRAIATRQTGAGC